MSAVEEASQLQSRPEVVESAVEITELTDTEMIPTCLEETQTGEFEQRQPTQREMKQKAYTEHSAHTSLQGLVIHIKVAFTPRHFDVFLCCGKVIILIVVQFDRGNHFQGTFTKGILRTRLGHL